MATDTASRPVPRRFRYNEATTEADVRQFVQAALDACVDSVHLWDDCATWGSTRVLRLLCAALEDLSEVETIRTIHVEFDAARIVDSPGCFPYSLHQLGLGPNPDVLAALPGAVNINTLTLREYAHYATSVLPTSAKADAACADSSDESDLDAELDPDSDSAPLPAPCSVATHPESSESEGDPERPDPPTAPGAVFRCVAHVQRALRRQARQRAYHATHLTVSRERLLRHAKHTAPITPATRFAAPTFEDTDPILGLLPSVFERAVDAEAPDSGVRLVRFRAPPGVRVVVHLRNVCDAARTHGVRAFLRTLVFSAAVQPSTACEQHWYLEDARGALGGRRAAFSPAVAHPVAFAVAAWTRYLPDPVAPLMLHISPRARLAQHTLRSHVRALAMHSVRADRREWLLGRLGVSDAACDWPLAPPGAAT